MNAYQKLNLHYSVEMLFSDDSVWLMELDSDTLNNTLICYDCFGTISEDKLNRVHSTFVQEQPLNYIFVSSNQADSLFTDTSRYKKHYYTQNLVDSLKGHVFVVDIDAIVRRKMQPETKEDFADLTQSVALLMPGKLKPKVVLKKEIDK